VPCVSSLMRAATLRWALLEAGNDVLEVGEVEPGADDEWVVGLAVSDSTE